MKVEAVLKEIAPYNVRKAVPAYGKTALLVIDMQEYFRKMATPILGRVKDIISHCRSLNVPVIFTRHVHQPKEDGGLLAYWWGEVIVEGTEGAPIIKELAPNEKVITKNRYSAFYKTELEEYLQSLKITDLIICGVMTNLCCETTARDAFVRDYKVFFLADGTCTSNDDLQLASLKNLACGFAHVVSCSEIIHLLNKWKQFSSFFSLIK